MATGFADQLLSSGSNVLMLLATARVADADQFGVVGLLMTIFAMGLSIVRGGIGTPVMLLGAVPKAVLRAEVRAGLLVAVLLGLGIGTIVILTGSSLGMADLALPIALSAPIVLHQDVHRYASMSMDHGRSAILFDGMWAIVTAVVLMLTFVLPVSPQVVLWTWFAGAASSAFGLSITSRLVARGSELRAWWSRARPDRLRYVAEAALGAGPAVALAAVITILIGPIATAALRGAGTLMGPISMMMSALPLAVIPRAVRDQHSAEEIWKLLRKLAVAMSLFALLTGLIGSQLPLSVGRLLLGRSWAETAPLLAFTGLEYAALAWLYCAWALFRATGRSRLLLGTRLCHVVAASLISLIAAIIWRTALSAAIGLAAASIGAAAVALVVGRTRRMTTGPSKAAL